MRVCVARIDDLVEVIGSIACPVDPLYQAGGVAQSGAPLDADDAARRLIKIGAKVVSHSRYVIFGQAHM